MCVDGYIGEFVCEQMKKVFVCASEFVQESVCVSVCTGTYGFCNPS